MEPEQRFIRVDLEEQFATVRFIERSIRDEDKVKRAVSEILDVPRRHNVKRLIVNFEDIENLTSIFLGRMVLANGLLEQWDVELRLCGLSEHLLGVFNICKLDRILKVYPTEADAR